MNLNPTQPNIQAGPATHLVTDQRNDLPPEKGLLQRFWDSPLRPFIIGASLTVVGVVAIALALNPAVFSATTIATMALLGLLLPFLLVGGIAMTCGGVGLMVYSFS